MLMNGSIDYCYRPTFTVGTFTNGDTYWQGNWGGDNINDNLPPMQIVPLLPTPVHELERCRYCGIKHEEHDKYCEACGAPL